MSRFKILKKTRGKIFFGYLIVALLPLVTAMVMILAIYPFSAETEKRSAKPGDFDVSYMWAPDLARALDYLKEIGEILDSESYGNLRIVKRISGDCDYGVIYDLNGDHDSASELAREHSKLLKSAELDPASIIKDEGYHDLYNISYVLQTDLETQKGNYKKIAQILGPLVTRDLVIEQLSDSYAVVYKSLVDKESGTIIAEKHSELLKPEGLVAIVARENNNEVIYGESSYLDEILETESLYNISYGLGPNLEVQKKNYEKVSQILGAEVAKGLVIQKTHYGNYLLEYITRGDENSTRILAREHQELLRPARLSAAVVRESNMNTNVYGGSPRVNGLVAVKARETSPVVEAGKEVTPALEEENIPVVEEAEKPEVHASPGESGLQQQIQSYISELKRTGKLSANDRVACSVYDFTSGEKLVSINEDKPMQAASMIKPLVALAFFHETEQGRLIYGSRSKANMQSMIHRSGNSSTNWVMRQVGGPGKIQEILKTHYASLFTDIRIVEYIPKRGKTYLNKASAHDYDRFLYAMWNGQLPYSREFRRLMALPNNDRVCHGANKVPKGTLVYDKTGSTSRMIGNMAILVAQGKDGKRYPYTLICMIEKSSIAPNYTTWSRGASSIIREVSNKVYTVMKKRHDLV